MLKGINEKQGVSTLNGPAAIVITSTGWLFCYQLAVLLPKSRQLPMQMNELPKGL